MSKTKTVQKWALASAALRDAYTDFMLSRQAMNCTPSTLEFYKYTAGKFMEWIESRGVTSPEEVTARYVREYPSSHFAPERAPYPCKTWEAGKI